MNLEAQGYSSLPAVELQTLCNKAHRGILAKLKEKIERNRAKARWDWENRSWFVRLICWLFREKTPCFDDDQWILNNTTLHLNSGWHGVLLRAYRWDEQRALVEMLALCKTVSCVTPVWFSSEFAVMLQALISEDETIPA